MNLELSMMHGVGIFFNNKGETYIGLFVDNEPIGFIKKYLQDKSIQILDYANDHTYTLLYQG